MKWQKIGCKTFKSNGLCKVLNEIGFKDSSDVLSSVKTLLTRIVQIKIQYLYR